MITFVPHMKVPVAVTCAGSKSSLSVSDVMLYPEKHATTHAHQKMGWIWLEDRETLLPKESLSLESQAYSLEATWRGT